MSPSNQQVLMNSLKDKGPDVWLEYIRPFEQGAPITGLSMQVIFHYAAPLAKTQNSLDWAEVAVRAAEVEASNCNAVERENAQLWAMNLRAWFICKMGSRSGDLVLDKSIILEWVLDSLKPPVQTAKEKAASFRAMLAGAKSLSDQGKRQQTIDDLHELRRIKLRLNVAKTLAGCGELASDSFLSNWLEIHDELP